MFVLVIGLFIVQCLFIHRYGEPYPALTMPPFQGSGGYRDGRVELSRYDFVFIARDGQEFTFAPKVVLEEFPDSVHSAIALALAPPRESSGTTEQRTLFVRMRDVVFPGYAAAVRLRGSAGHNASLASWLRTRSTALLPGRDVVRAEIRWYREKVKVDGDTFHIDREPAGILRFALDRAT